MKKKIEDVLYFLTMWFSASIIVLFIISIIFTNIKNKEYKPEKTQLYTIQSPMILDSIGNVTIIRKVIDHEPTHQDSVELGFMFK